MASLTESLPRNRHAAPEEPPPARAAHPPASPARPALRVVTAPRATTPARFALAPNPYAPAVGRKANAPATPR